MFFVVAVSVFWGFVCLFLFAKDQPAFINTKNWLIPQLKRQRTSFLIRLHHDRNAAIFTSGVYFQNTHKNQTEIKNKEPRKFRESEKLGDS